MSIKILITGQTFLPDTLKLLEKKGYEVEIIESYLDEDTLGKLLEDKDAYILGGLEFASADVLKRATKLKVISVMGVGFQTFADVEAATQAGIAVTNTPGANSRAVAEITIGLMLAMIRKIYSINRLTKTGKWSDTIVTKNLHRKTLGIIGMGAIGSIVAQIAAAGFRMNILYFSPSPKPDIENATGAKRVGLDELLRSSDIISIHCPLTSQSRYMIGIEEFHLMKENCILINTARPHIIEPEALAAALKKNKIVCAMDGYYIEPAPAPENDTYGLLSIPDDVFLITSHLAYLTDESIQKMCEMAAYAVINLLEGKDWRYVVNPLYKKYRQIDNVGTEIGDVDLSAGRLQ